MLDFFRRGDAVLWCETRLNPDTPGYQLVVTENSMPRVENFAEIPRLLGREHELLLAWRPQERRDVGDRCAPQ